MTVAMMEKKMKQRKKEQIDIETLSKNVFSCKVGIINKKKRNNGNSCDGEEDKERKERIRINILRLKVYPFAKLM